MSVQTNEFLSKSHLPAARADALKKLHAEAVAARKSSPAGWHGADDIKTLIGLGGQFLWAEDPLHVAQIEFTFDPAHVGSQGTYLLKSGATTKEAGIFHSMPNNPAIGWASLTLIPGSAPAALRSFVVAGMETDSHWKIIILLLNKLGDHGPIQPPFSAIRMA